MAAGNAVSNGETGGSAARRVPAVEQWCGGYQWRPLCLLCHTGHVHLSGSLLEVSLIRQIVVNLFRWLKLISLTKIGSIFGISEECPCTIHPPSVLLLSEHLEFIPNNSQNHISSISIYFQYCYASTCNCIKTFMNNYTCFISIYSIFDKIQIFHNYAYYNNDNIIFYHVSI